MGNDTEVWLLFAPFWLLGIAQAAGHVRKASLFSRRLAWHELTDDGRHHLRRGLIAFAAFVALCLLGVGVGAAVELLLGH